MRLTTYEDEQEAAFLRKLFLGRSGEVENTTFTILSPDASKTLSRTGRSARNVFRSPATMAQEMTRLAGLYPGSAEAARTNPALPVTLNARLGLNVAAGDLQPLVLVQVASQAERSNLEGRLASLAWSDEFLGRFVYTSVATRKELPPLTGLKEGEGIVVVVPDTFGMKGQVLVQLPANADEKAIAAGLRKALTQPTGERKTMHEHRRAGITAGAFWEPKLPVTDPQEVGARNRARREIDRARNP
ncbi:MAG: thioredoxin family protein [Gemmataceae bacterium]